MHPFLYRLLWKDLETFISRKMKCRLFNRSVHRNTFKVAGSMLTKCFTFEKLIKIIGYLNVCFGINKKKTEGFCVSFPIYVYFFFDFMAA